MSSQQCILNYGTRSADTMADLLALLDIEEEDEGYVELDEYADILTALGY